MHLPMLFGGADTVAARFVYVLVGLAAVYQALQVKGIQRRWGVTTSRTASMA